MSRRFDELSEAEDDALAYALAATLPVVRPSPGGRARLLVAVANPWVRLLARFAALVDVPPDVAERMLDRAQAGADWVPGPLAGVSVVHLAGGPATAGADVGLVRMAAGDVFPAHAHLGVESIVLLSGSYADSAGYVLYAGDAESRQVGQPHSLTAGADGVVFAVVLREGIAVDDPAGGPPVLIRG